jgi:lipoprotein-releasing system permease protein
MFNAFERMVAFRYLRARRQEGFISVIAIFSLLGIALGVATLIIVMSVMNGFRAELLGRIVGFNGHINVFAAQGRLTNYDALAQKVKTLPGLAAVRPIIEGQVLASARGGSTGAMVRGLDERDLAAQKLIASHLQPQELEAFKDDNVLVGTRLAFRLGVKPGDQITILSPQGTATAFGTVPRVKSYRIAGTFSVGMYEYDASFVFMPLAAAQTFFDLPDAVSSLEIFVDDPDQVYRYDAELQQMLGPSFRVFDWQHSNLSLFNAVQVERNVMFLILTLIIVVAAFNIISSMIMLVKDKGRDIAIMRTMGATRGMILRIFIAFTLNIERIREAIQSIIGTDLFSAEIYFFTQIPARIDGGEIAAVLGMAFGLSFLATIYPSWRAARLDPVEALRYE